MITKRNHDGIRQVSVLKAGLVEQVNRDFFGYITYLKSVINKYSKSRGK
jgi:hypothetical protein